MKPDEKVRKFKHKRGRGSTKRAKIYVAVHAVTGLYLPRYGAWAVKNLVAAFKSTDPKDFNVRLALREGYKIVELQEAADGT